MPKISFNLNSVITYLLAFLAVILIFHNLLIQFLVFKLDLPQYIALYKEFLTLLIIILMSFCISKKVYLERNLIKFNTFLPLILWLILLILMFISSVFNQTEIKWFILGFRLELWWLLFFVISFVYLKLFKINFQILNKSLFFGFVLVSFINILILFFGHVNILSPLGFGSGNTETNLKNTPLCSQIDFQVSGCRLDGGFSSPNHFAGYLLLILPVLIYNSFSKNSYFKVFSKFLLILNFVFVFLSFARFSWLALVVCILFAFLFFLKKLIDENLKVSNFIKSYSQKVFSILGFLVIFGGLLFAVVIVNLDPNWLINKVPVFLAKPSSSIEHYRQTQASLEILKDSNWQICCGFGPSSSGSNPRNYEYPDNPLVKNFGYLAFKWYLQPSPGGIVLPENWFLQIWLNQGFVYLIFYLMLLIIPVLSLFKAIFLATKNISIWQIITSLAFFAIIFGNFFLHIFESQIISLYWTLIFIWSRFID
jgi:hypothetical protein